MISAPRRVRPCAGVLVNLPFKLAQSINHIIHPFEINEVAPASAYLVGAF